MPIGKLIAQIRSIVPIAAYKQNKLIHMINLSTIEPEQTISYIFETSFSIDMEHDFYNKFHDHIFIFKYKPNTQYLISLSSYCEQTNFNKNLINKNLKYKLTIDRTLPATTRSAQNNNPLISIFRLHDSISLTQLFQIANMLRTKKYEIMSVACHFTIPYGTLNSIRFNYTITSSDETRNEEENNRLGCRQEERVYKTINFRYQNITENK